MIDIKFKIENTLPPAIVRFLDKSYAVKGNEWIPVPLGTSLSDLNIEIDNTPEEKFKVSLSTEKHEVKSSKGDKTYTVTVEKTNERVTQVSCTCTGYGFRRRCKHSDKFKN